MHHSQNIISETEKETIFQYYLIPTYDFIQEILSYGNRVKVLEPKNLCDIIISELQKNINQYKK